MFLIDYQAICVILCAPKSSHACPSCLHPRPRRTHRAGGEAKWRCVMLRFALRVAARLVSPAAGRAVTSNRAYNSQYETCSATPPPRCGLLSPFNYLPEGTVEDGPKCRMPHGQLPGLLPCLCPGGSDHPRFRHRLRRFDTSSTVRSRSPLRIIPAEI